MSHIGVMLPDPLEPDWLYVPDETVQRPAVELFVPDAERTDTPPYLYLQHGEYYQVEGFSAAERDARTVRWEIPLLVLNQDLANVLVRLAPLAASALAARTGSSPCPVGDVRRRESMSIFTWVTMVARFAGLPSTP